MFFERFFHWQKVGPKPQISPMLAASGCRDGTFWEGSAGEAACPGGERGGGVMLPESIHLRV